MSDRSNALAILVIVTGVLVTFTAVLVVQRNMLFDDAFISYRYAKNLAFGYGLTWNRNEAPVEGYTNFLLVAALAPIIRLGQDPLLATRVWSVAAALGLAWLLFRVARRDEGASAPAALLFALAYLPAAKTFLLSTVGLETLIFTFFLFLSFWFGVAAQRHGRRRDVAWFGAGTLLAFLFRPDALLLAGLWSAILLLAPGESWSGRRLRGLAVLAATLGAPVLLYLGWKELYFGSVLPNAFFIKAAHTGLVSRDGLASVVAYYSKARILVALAVLSLLCEERARRPRALAALFVVLFSAFYARVETLMDVYERFLYPVTPFLFYLGMPVICRLFERLLAWRPPAVLKACALPAIFVLLFFPNLSDDAEAIVQAASGIDRFSNKDDVMQRENRVAHQLARYPHIKEISIAWGNAGLIPYITEARFIDTVGINDRTIARAKNWSEVVSYVFSQRPTLIILPTRRDLSWFAGHSRMNMADTEWTSDLRWDDYAYAGTVIAEANKLHHYLVRRDYHDFANFRSFVSDEVVDMVPPEPPIRLGSSARQRAAD